MRIGIDVSSIIKRHPSGIRNYIFGLLQGFLDIHTKAHIDMCVRLSRLKKWQRGLFPESKNFHLKIIQEPLNLFYPKKIDLFHGTDSRLPRFNGCVLVATIHDVFSLLEGDYMEADFREMKTKRYADICRRAHKIIADSHCTKKDIIEHFNCREDLIDVIPLGVSSSFVPQSKDSIKKATNSIGIEGDYILYVGIINKRKNVARIIETFNLIKKTIHSPLSLVLIGRQVYGAEEALALIDASPFIDNIIRISSVSLDILTALYSGARFVLFPSLYEGFGLPILESMACGTPVVTSNVSSLPEVAQDAAILIDPIDVEGIAEAGLSLLQDNNLHAEYRKRGLKHVKKFTWAQTAEKTLNTYWSALKEA